MSAVSEISQYPCPEGWGRTIDEAIGGWDRTTDVAARGMVREP